MMEQVRHHNLKPYNTFGIEAFAMEFRELETDEELIDFIRSRMSQLASLVIIGGGSNILLTGDVQGTVAKISTLGVEVTGEDAESIHVRVAAGEDWDELVALCVSNGWGGLENLSGIPGQAGSSPIQNIGAYGSELKDHFLSLEAINRCTGEVVHFDLERCQFGYRDSIFKRALKGRVVISHVTFRLDKNPVFNLTYHALKQKLGHIPNVELSLQKVRDAVLEIRASKLPDPKVMGNAGSFFKNPLVSLSQLESLKERYPGIVSFEVKENKPPKTSVKLSAGWLIEQCGWKGYRDGDAGVHRDQALVLVNYGLATGKDILALSEKIRYSVLEKFGVELEREVNII